MSGTPPPVPSAPPALPRSKAGLPALVWVAIGLAIGVCVLAAIGIFSAAVFAASQSALKKARQIQALNTATALQRAVENYHAAYGNLPDPRESEGTGDALFDTSTPEGAALVAILTGKEPDSPNVWNPKRKTFLNVPPGKEGKNGLVENPPGPPALLDVWGRGYKVMLDMDLDETLTPPPDSGCPFPMKDIRVLVYSLGPDGKGGDKAVRTR